MRLVVIIAILNSVNLKQLEKEMATHSSIIFFFFFKLYIIVVLSLHIEA